MTSQQYGILWLAEFSQVQDLSVVLMLRPTLTTFGVFDVTSLKPNVFVIVTNFRQHQIPRLLGIGEQGPPPGLPHRHHRLLDFRHSLADPTQQHPR